MSPRVERKPNKNKTNKKKKKKLVDDNLRTVLRVFYDAKRLRATYVSRTSFFHPKFAERNWQQVPQRSSRTRYACDFWKVAWSSRSVRAMRPHRVPPPAAGFARASMAAVAAAKDEPPIRRKKRRRRRRRRRVVSEIRFGLRIFARSLRPPLLVSLHHTRPGPALPKTFASQRRRRPVCVLVRLTSVHFTHSLDIRSLAPSAFFLFLSRNPVVSLASVDPTPCAGQKMAAEIFFIQKPN